MSQFRPGDRVALRRQPGAAAELNHHVGRVSDVWEQGHWDERVQVRLHGTVWDGVPVDAPRLVAVRTTHLDACGPPTRAMAVGTPDARALLPLLARGCRLPAGLPERVLEYLRVEPVIPDEVTAVAASSTSEPRTPLDAVLAADDGRWWISARFAPPPGAARWDLVRGTVFDEWLEFSLGARPRVVSYVGVKIPPLPQGPLSVREFRVEYRDDARDAAGDGAGGGWTAACPGAFVTLDRAEVQEFALPAPVQARRLRLVFTRAAHPPADCIGLFEVRFR